MLASLDPLREAGKEELCPKIGVKSSNLQLAPGTYPNMSHGRERRHGIRSLAHRKIPQSVPLTLQFLGLGL